jgi:hypothetical protein
MKRMTVLALLVWVLLPSVVWAHYHWCNNEHGSISISMSGIETRGSQLTYLFGIVPPKGHSLGLVIFSTGAMLTGSPQTGGTFSATGSSFKLIGKGNYGEPKGTIFSGFFNSPITWTLISKNGANLVFKIHGDLTGQTYTGAMVTGETSQTIVSTEGQLAKGIGHIVSGKMDVGP